MLDDTTSRGYFLNNLEDFDSTFFGISPKEAILMDPQQRISLEVTWEALEDAGIPPQSLAGSNTAVYMGVNSDDYSKLLLEDLPGIEAWRELVPRTMVSQTAFLTSWTSEGPQPRWVLPVLPLSLPFITVGNRFWPRKPI